MRKSFELLDWMKEHFGSSTPGEPGQGGILYRFTHGLKESGGVVKVDEGNGLAVNEHTGMLEVPIGEHLSYTSQGIDAKEGDTAQKGVVQLSDSITPESTHETAVTPQAVKEYVDANAGSGGSGGIDMSGQTVYTGSGTVRIVSESFNDSRYNAILNAQNKGGGYCGFAVNGRVARIGYGFNKEATSSPGLYVSVSDEAVRIAAPSFVYNNNKVVTEANLADEQNLGVVKLTHTVSHGEHPNEAVSPDGVAAYVDAKVAGAGGFSIVKAVGSNPDFALSSGDMIKSGNTLYGVLVFTCKASPTLVTEIASLPATLTRSIEVVLTRASNNVLQYTATATGSGTVKFASEISIQQGTYVAVIAAQTN